MIDRLVRWLDGVSGWWIHTWCQLLGHDVFPLVITLQGKLWVVRCHRCGYHVRTKGTVRYLP